MSSKFTAVLSKTAFAILLGVAVSAAHAAVGGTSDEEIVQTVKTALHKPSGGLGFGIRVQAIDGVVYLYGHADTYLQKVDIEELARAAAAGHKVVSSIDDGSFQ